MIGERQESNLRNVGRPICYLGSMNVSEMGRVLKAARKAKGLTMKEAGLACGRSYQWIDNLEAGRREASFEDMSKLAEVLGLRLMVDLVPSEGDQVVYVDPKLTPVVNGLSLVPDSCLGHLQRIVEALQKAPLEAVSSATYLLEMATQRRVSGDGQPDNEAPVGHRQTA